MKPIFLALLFVCSKQELSVIYPPELAANFTDASNPTGAIKYSLSLFGSSLLYSEFENLNLFKAPADNEDGCLRMDPLYGKSFVLVKRGGCTYSKKAFMCQISGALGVVVYHDDPDVNISQILPISDSICFLTRQQR